MLLLLLYIQTEVNKGNILIFSFNFITPATTTTTTTTETIKQFSTRVKKKKI